MGTLRLMTWNLRRDVPADGPNAWPARSAAVVRVLRDAAPDVLATQEGLPHQLADLDQAFPSHVRVGECRRGDGSDEVCAIHFDTRRLELEAWGTFWLSDEPARPGSATWGNDLPRTATWARLRDRQDGAVVTVASTHLDHRSAASRLRAADLLAERLPGAVLLGDFNEPPGGPAHRALLAAGWTDPAADGGEAGTWHAFGAEEGARIDWALVPEGATVARTSILRPRPAPSDHDPVVADLLVAPEEGPDALATAAQELAFLGPDTGPAARLVPRPPRARRR